MTRTRFPRPLAHRLPVPATALFGASIAALVAMAPLPAPAQSAPSPLASFTRTLNAAISGYNREHLNGVSPEACATACLADARKSWCVSFDYYKASQQCDLSDKRAADVGGLKTDYAGNPYDHYALNPARACPTRSWAPTAGAMCW